jgi:hypothetical protein
MAALDIGSLRPGMVVASDVVGARQRVLVPAGTMLEDKHLRALKKWGVVEVDVVGEVASDPPEDELIARADHLFRHTDRSHPVMALLYDAFLKRGDFLKRGLKLPDEGR